MDVDTARDAGFHVGDTVDVLSAGPRRTFELVGRVHARRRRRHRAVGVRRVRPAHVAADRGRARAARRGLRARRPRASTPPRSGGRSGRRSVPATRSPTPPRSRAPATRTSASSSTCSPACCSGSPRSGVVVGAFIIFNTFTILVTQRTRELGSAAGDGRVAPAGHHRRSSSRRRSWARSRRPRRVRARRARGARLLMSLVDSLGFRIPSGDIVVLPRTVGARGGAWGWWSPSAPRSGRRSARRGSHRSPPSAISPRPGSTRSGGARRSGSVLRRRQRAGAPGRHRPGAAVPTTPSASCRSSVSGRCSSSSASWCCWRRSRVRWRGCSARRSARLPGVPGAIAARERDAQPAPHRGDRERARHRARAGRDGRGAGRVGQGADRRRPTPISGPSWCIDTTQFTGFSPEVIDRVEALPEVTSAVGFHFGRIPIDEAERERIIGMNGTGLADAFDLQLRPGSTADTRRRRDARLAARTASAFGWRWATRCSLAVPDRRARRARRRRLRRRRRRGSARRSSCRASCSGRRSRKPTSTTAPTSSVAPGVPVRTAKAAIDREIEQRLPEPRGAHPGPGPRRRGRAGRPVPRGARRAAVPVGGDRGARHREHAGAVGPRAHARDRDAARGRA